MKKTVLIIDDEPVDRFIVENMITRSGLDWNIVQFPDATKALNYLSFRYAHTKTVPEVIILDLLMPVMDGLQFLDTIKREPYSKLSSQVKIIALTISGGPERHKEALRRGALKVLSKPFEVNNFLQALQ